MLDTKLLEDCIPDIENWTYRDLQEIKLLSEDEIKGIAKKVECDEYCDIEVISLCVTALYNLNKAGQIVLRKEEIFKPKKLDTTIKYETTGVDKCDEVTCDEKYEESYEFRRCME